MRRLLFCRISRDYRRTGTDRHFRDRVGGISPIKFPAGGGVYTGRNRKQNRCIVYLYGKTDRTDIQGGGVQIPCVSQRKENTEIPKRTGHSTWKTNREAAHRAESGRIND